MKRKPFNPFNALIDEARTKPVAVTERDTTEGRANAMRRLSQRYGSLLKRVDVDANLPWSPGYAIYRPVLKRP